MNNGDMVAREERPESITSSGQGQETVPEVEAEVGAAVQVEIIGMVAKEEEEVRVDK